MYGLSKQAKTTRYITANFITFISFYLSFFTDQEIVTISESKLFSANKNLGLCNSFWLPALFFIFRTSSF